MDRFCERFRQLREETGVSMKQVADAVGVSDAAVCKWENGNAEPKVSYLIKLAEYFECSIDYIAGKTNDFGMATHAEPPLKLTQKEKKLINSFRQLTPGMKKLLQQTVDAWNNYDGTEENQ